MPNDYSLALLLKDGDRDERAYAERKLLRLLDEVTGTIEAYADDHNSDRPTDVTVLLPRLRRALGR